MKSRNYDTPKPFREPSSLCVYHRFLRYILRAIGNVLVAGSVLSIAIYVAWIVRFVVCSLEQETRGGHFQRRYADTFGRNKKRLAVEQIFGKIRVFVE